MDERTPLHVLRGVNFHSGPQCEFPVCVLLRGAVDAGPVAVAALVVVVLVAGLATGALLLRVVVVHVDLSGYGN